MTVEEWKRKNPSIRRKPQTNADSIRSMTDEELAEMLFCVDHITKDSWGNYDPQQIIMGHMFRDESEVLDWLKSPVEGKE